MLPRWLMCIWLSYGVLIGSQGLALAQPQVERTLIVGTKQAPPFAIKNPDGTWSGISIDLWRWIAESLKLTYELREFNLQGLLDGVTQHQLDLAVAALSITAERETHMDFTHPFYNTGLGIAVSRLHQRPWLSVLRTFVSGPFLQLVGGLILILLTIGVLVWLFERKRNPQQFEGSVLQGIWSGFWWAAVTMTTVGYGDKAPATIKGRVLALIWMFTSLVIISSFIAAITSVLTLSQSASSVRGPQDLSRVRVATVTGSTSEAYLHRQRLAFTQYPTPLEGLQAVASGTMEALVYDEALLRYLIKSHLQGQVEVLSDTFEHQDYGIALPAGSPLREPITRALLERLTQPVWQDILYRYLGQ